MHRLEDAAKETAFSSPGVTGGAHRRGRALGDARMAEEVPRSNWCRKHQFAGGTGIWPAARSLYRLCQKRLVGMCGHRNNGRAARDLLVGGQRTRACAWLLLCPSRVGRPPLASRIAFEKLHITGSDNDQTSTLNSYVPAFNSWDRPCTTSPLSRTVPLTGKVTVAEVLGGRATT